MIQTTIRSGPGLDECLDTIVQTVRIVVSWPMIGRQSESSARNHRRCAAG